MYNTIVYIKLFIAVARRMKIEIALSFSPAIRLKLKILVALYVTAMVMKVTKTEFLKLIQNQFRVAISLGKHPKSTLARKMCSNTKAFKISVAEMKAMIWLKMDLF